MPALAMVTVCCSITWHNSGEEGEEGGKRGVEDRGKVMDRGTYCGTQQSVLKSREGRTERAERCCVTLQSDIM